MSINEYQELQKSVKPTPAKNNLMEETGPQLGFEKYVICFNNPYILQKRTYRCPADLNFPFRTNYGLPISYKSQYLEKEEN